MRVLPVGLGQRQHGQLQANLRRTPRVVVGHGQGSLVGVQHAASGLHVGEHPGGVPAADVAATSADTVKRAVLLWVIACGAAWASSLSRARRKLATEERWIAVTCSSATPTA